MKNYIKIAFLIFSFLLVGMSIQAQVYKFTQFDESNGLISNQTTEILQDSRWYLWVGTEKGLSRFDGNNFINYDKINGLSENAVSDIKMNKAGELFIFHPNGRITKIANDYSFVVKDSLHKIENEVSFPALICKVSQKNNIQI